MNRVLKVVRLQLVNRQTFIWIPLIILSGAFVLSLVVFSLIPVDGAKYGGAAQAPLWYFLAAGAMTVAYTFPFSQAMSITRREYFFGSVLTAMLTSAMLAVISVIGSAIERATDGWGMNGYFFAPPWLSGYDWNTSGASFEWYPFEVWGPAVLNFAIALTFFIVGFWCATIFKRFGAMWLTVTLIGGFLALIGLAWLAGEVDAWPTIGAWAETQSTAMWGFWLLLLCTALGGASYLTLRRAVP